MWGVSSPSAQPTPIERLLGLWRFSCIAEKEQIKPSALVILLSRRQGRAAGEKHPVCSVSAQSTRLGPGVGRATWETRAGFVAELRVEGGQGAGDVTVSGESVPGRGISRGA